MPSRRHYLTGFVDRSAIIHNCKIIRQLIAPTCKLCVTVKCNAYGHGIEAVLPALTSADVDMLCVSAIHEAKKLTQLGWDGPVLMLGSQFSIYTGKEKKQLAEWIIENELRITAVDENDIEVLTWAANMLGKPAIVHFMLDSGMGRMGLDETTLLELIDKTKNNSHIVIEGLYTHFATAEDPDKAYANYQLKRFNTFIEKLEKAGMKIPLIHTANTGATIDLPDSHFNMVRPGLSIYGCYPNPKMLKKPDLKPALKVVSYLTLIKSVPAGSFIGYGCAYKAAKDMTIGVVPVGYGDGYDRRLSNTGKMKVAGHIVPVVGAISMDQTVVDLTELVNKGLKFTPGREITVIDNDRTAPNSIESLAIELETSPYEILTRLGQRIVRVPVD